MVQVIIQAMADFQNHIVKNYGKPISLEMLHEFAKMFGTIMEALAKGEER